MKSALARISVLFMTVGVFTVYAAERQSFARLESPSGRTQAPGLRPRGERPPNIVLILIDDLGWKDLGCYGSAFHQTPNIDALAKKGMLFTAAYASSPICSPSRASIMTGKYPARLRFTGHITPLGRHRHPPTSRIIPPDDFMYLRSEEVTIAEALKPAKYVSASIGKWHLGAQPLWPEAQGFNLNAGGRTRGSTESYFYPYTDPKATANPEWTAAWSSESLPLSEGGRPGEYLTDRLTDEAVRFIKANKDQPFFLYLPHFAVHTPLQAPEPLVKKYSARLPTGAPQNRATYAAMVESVDQSVGRLTDTLRQLGLDDNTVIIFTSDNGGVGAADNSPLRAGKGHLYEGGIRVPLIVVWPGQVKAGSTCRVPVVGADLRPTITQLAGNDVRTNQNIDGRSLVPLLTGQGRWHREELYWYYPHYSPHGNKPGAAIRAGDYKLIENYDPANVELYDLSGDIGERVDLAGRMPQITTRLRAKLHDWLKSVDAKTHTLNPQYAP